MNRNDLNRFVGKEIGLLYNDSGKDFFCRGVLIEIGDNSITIRTKKNIVTISFDAIKKIKSSICDSKKGGYKYEI